jgi:hypothetical protein
MKIYRLWGNPDGAEFYTSKREAKRESRALIAAGIEASIDYIIVRGASGVCQMMNARITGEPYDGERTAVEVHLA